MATKEMILHTLHTISGCFVVLAIIAKIIIHYYLDKLHQRSVGLASLVIIPLNYLKPYRSDVDSNHILLKKGCNFMLLLAGIFLFINLMLGLLIYS